MHCDPHGANVLVRRHPHGGKRSRRPQLVLLDHGLYRELTEQFRVDYCRLWKAMIFKDIPGESEGKDITPAGSKGFKVNGTSSFLFSQ